MPPEIVVVDYDAGNLRSVQRALEAVGQRPVVTSDPHEVERAEALVLPGVGSAQDCMRKLATRGLIQPLKDYAASGRPFLGVCVGLQLLFDGSEEGGGVECRTCIVRSPVGHLAQRLLGGWILYAEPSAAAPITPLTAELALAAS